MKMRYIIWQPSALQNAALLLQITAEYCLSSWYKGVIQLIYLLRFIILIHGVE